MALNLATFKTRTLTAAVFVLVMLAGILWNHWSFFILFSVIHFGCWMEYQRLIARIDPDYAQISPYHKYGVVVAGWCIMLYFTSDAFRFFGIRLHALGWWLGLLCAFLLPINELLFSKQIQLKNIKYSALGLLYISLSWGLMMDLRTQSMGDLFGSFIDFGWIIPLVLILSIWINDTMAYLAGSMLGRTQLSSISPKKTWEGTLLGAVLAIFIIGIIAWLLEMDYVQAAIVAGIASIAGTFGDLLQSKLKRMANVKDSGHIMPGHGGFLDRFDSLLVATPCVWLYITLLNPP